LGEQSSVLEIAVSHVTGEVIRGHESPLNVGREREAPYVGVSIRVVEDPT
jgi:hypothetical protein